MFVQFRLTAQSCTRVVQTYHKQRSIPALLNVNHNTKYVNRGLLTSHYSNSSVLCVLMPASQLTGNSYPNLAPPHSTSHQHARQFSMESLQRYYSPDFPPVGYAQKLLEAVYDTTGLPWWATILVTTVVLRSLITLPLGIISQRNAVKLYQLQPVLHDKSELLKMEIAAAIKMYKWDKKVAAIHYKTNMKRIVRQEYIAQNCHPVKSTVVFWVQLPIWFGLSLALRNMTGTMPFRTSVIHAAVHPELCMGGALWFTNFIVPDPLFLLPVICAALNLVNCEMMALSKEDRTKFQKIVTNVFRGLSLIVLPVGLVLPSCMVYYWTCSSVLGLAQTLAMKSPTIKRSLRIPILPNESKTPYSDMIQVAKRRYGKPFRRKDGSA